jgi:hypothetical protein
LALFAVSFVGWVAFVYIQRAEGDDALLPLRMFKVRTVAVATIVNFIMGFAMFGGLAGLPLYLQISRGMSPTRAGLAMIPFTVGILLAAVIATRIIYKTLRYKWIPVVGAFLLVVGTLLLSLLSYDSPFSDIALYAIVFGAGLGCIMQPLMLAVQNALPAKDNGAGTASVMFSRQIGGSLGAAVFLSILFGTVADRIKEAFMRAAETQAFQSAASDPAVLSSGKNGIVLQALATGDLAQAEAAGVSLNDTSFLKDLHPQIAAPFRIGFSDAINGVMLIAAAIITVAFIVSFFLPSLRLSEKSGLENLLDERAAEVEAEAILADESESVTPEPARVRPHGPTD